MKHRSRFSDRIAEWIIIFALYAALSAVIYQIFSTRQFINQQTKEENAPQSSDPVH